MCEYYAYVIHMPFDVVAIDRLSNLDKAAVFGTPKCALEINGLLFNVNRMTV